MALHISRDGAEIGAWTEEEVRGFYREGSLVATDHYWKEGMTEWLPLISLMEVPAVSPPVAIPEPPPVKPAAAPLPASPPVESKPPPAKRKFNWTVILGSIGVLLGIAAVLVITSLLKSDNFDSDLAQASVEVNQRCPMMVDSITRLDGSSAGPGRKFTYRYTIMGNQTLSADDIQTKLRPVLIKSWETNPSIALYRQKGVTLEYQYSTEDKHPLATITFNANDVPQQ